MTQQGHAVTKLEINSDAFCIVVTGPRDWIDKRSVWMPLERMRNRHQRLLIRNGKAKKGVDHLAGLWASRREGKGVIERAFPADWDTYGKRAGHIRNGEMLRAFPRPDLVMVWGLPCRLDAPWCPPGVHPTHGTANCVEQARDLGLKVTFCPEGLVW